MVIAWLSMTSRLLKQCRTHKQRHATAAIELDWSDSGTWTGVGAAVLGIAIGIGAPIFYSQRDDLDEARLEDLREMNRQHYKETGRYLTDVSCSHTYEPRSMARHLVVIHNNMANNRPLLGLARYV